MVILALLIGLVAGAAGVYAVGLRRALSDRDRANLEARDAQRLLAETEGALAAERGAFDVRVENAIKALSTEAPIPIIPGPAWAPSTGPTSET